jgi:hypothetical protein
MTEAEWLACTDPQAMLKTLPARGNERKLRLFACACLRRIWHLLPFGQDERVALGMVEQFADGLIGKSEFDAFAASLGGDEEEAEDSSELEEALARMSAGNALHRAVETAYGFMRQPRRLATAPRQVRRAALAVAREAARAVATAKVTGVQVGPERAEAEAGERRCQSDLVRDLFGPRPFRGRPAPAPRWLTWNGSTVVKLAQGTYDDRAPDRLPVLADALEEAGCADAGLLGDLRGPGPHVRGCWAVDLLLGKE